MKGDKKRKIGKGADIGVNTGSAVFAGAPLIIIVIASVIGFIIGSGIDFIAYLIRKYKKCAL